MDIGSPEHRRERSRSTELRDQDDSLSKHRGKSSRREDKEYRSKDREQSKTTHGSRDRERDLERERSSGKDRRSDDNDKQEKERSHGKSRESKERERDKDRKDRGKDKEREKEILDRDSERGREKEKGKERSREKDRDREKEREKEKDKHKEQGKVRESERGRRKDIVDKEKEKDRIREKEKEADQDGERQRDKDKGSYKHRNEGHDRSKHSRNDDESGSGATDNQGSTKMDTGFPDSEDSGKHQQDVDGGAASSEVGERIRRMREERLKEERLKKKPEGVSDILSWVAKSRKMEERKARQLSKTFEEQDNMIEGDDEGTVPNASHDLAGVKVLHGLDKVLEGGAVVLTLRDQSILSDRGVNEEVDELENVEIGEQKKRNDAYKAAKKKSGIFTDKFNEDDSLERKMLPQYDDPVTDEGLTLDARGSFTGDAERKLEELRKRIQGNPKSNYAEDLTTTGKLLSDYYTEEEMLKFNNKPKKKKTMRKREKLDIDAMEAEAKSAGLGDGDLGSRSDGRRQALRQERERDDAEKRKSAYQSALAKAEEASKALLAPKRKTVEDEDDTLVIGDDDDDLRKSLDRARKLALKSKSEAATSYPMTINLLTPVASESAVDNKTSLAETSENKVVFTEMELWSRQLDEEVQKSDGEDVFMEEDVVPNDSEEKKVKVNVKVEDGGWSEVKADIEEKDDEKKEEETAPENTIHETSVGKGLAGTLQLLNKRGSLKESIEWGGRNMDKKKSKLVGIHEDDGPKEIHLERTDEYGRILTPREAFRLLSHKFHGKGPGKMKQEKRMRQYQEELKIKQMENSDTPSHSVERMKEVQAQLKTPYLVLTGQVKPGQTSDPRSGFATVEGLPGGVTPMLGNQKVEYFLGKRKHDSGGSGSSVDKKPKT